MMKSMMKVAGLSLSLSLVACGGISSEKPAAADAPKVLPAKAAKPALVRFVNAAEGVAEAHFAVGDKAVEASLVPGAFMTSRAEVPAGEQTLKVLGGGTAALFESKLNLTADGHYTVVLLGNASGPGLSGRLDAIVLEDGPQTIASGKSLVRFVHAVPGGPAVSFSSAKGQTYVSGVNYEHTTPWVAGPGESENVRIVIDQTEAYTASVPFSEGRLYTVIARPKGESFAYVVINERP